MGRVIGSVVSSWRRAISYLRCEHPDLHDARAERARVRAERKCAEERHMEDTGRFQNWLETAMADESAARELNEALERVECPEARRSNGAAA